jgi:GNAT superfamily N-acetyltransferase
MAMSFVPLGPDTLADWLAFFDGPAFADNRDWGTCYCRVFVFGGGGYDAWDAACAANANRAPMIAAIQAGQIDGLLAREAGEVVGWVHYGPSSRFHTPVSRLEPDEDGVASIVCFVVHPNHRRTGVARGLLQAAIADLCARGFTAVDARPRQGETAAEQFTGPRALYLSEGFEPVDERRVRRSL